MVLVDERPGRTVSAFISPILLVTARTQQFHLSLSQIQFDSPNVFTQYLAKAGDSPPPLSIDRDPDIFALIVQYLSGYDILPLSVAAIPRTLTMEAAKRALVRDADLLQLSGLRSLLSTAFAPPARFMNWAGISTRVVNLSDILDEGVLSFGLMDKEGLPRPIFVHNFAIRFVPRAEFLVLGMKLLVQKLDLNDTQPVYEIVDCERGPLRDVLVYGQAEHDAQFEVDGRSCEPAKVPMHTPMLIAEAWMIGARSSLQSIGGKDIRCLLVKIIALKAETRSHIMRSLDYHTLTFDSEEATLGG